MLWQYQTDINQNKYYFVLKQGQKVVYKNVSYG